MQNELDWKIKVGREERVFVDWFLSFPNNVTWAKNRRLEYLRNRKKELLLNEACWVAKVIGAGLAEFLETDLKEVEKIEKEIDLYENPVYRESHLNEQKIENARNYPIEQIIDVNEQGFAVCPFHNDKNPSAFCKNNYLYCFSCDTQADTIKLYMHLNDCNFKQAVNSLQG